ncbi:carbon storage regulator [Pseudomonas nitroreducens]|uniref:carbon storage regulator n=1 Tax=Pseudomonas nitroreducens TaxID=46680 RepID=UPI000310D53B|nr:carbon storage regulator [Pseudomonas nitroreducens]
MGNLVLQRDSGEDIILSVDPATSDEDLIRQLRGDGIVVHIGRVHGKTADVRISAPSSIHIMRAELLPR